MTVARRLMLLAGLPLLATLLAAQAPQEGAKQATKLPPQKPAALAAQQKKTAAAAKPVPTPPVKPAQAAQAQKQAAAAAATPAPKPAAKPDAKQDAKTAAKPAGKTAAEKPDAGKPAPAKADFSDYFRVWGVGGDTTRAEIIARFGEPARVGDWDSKPFYYFNDTLRFFFGSDDTVSTMIVGNSFEPMPPKAIPRDVLDKAFIGKKRDDVLKAFGPAQAVSSDNYRYFPKAGVYKVEFQCYDVKGYVCEQMLVQF